VALNIDKIRPNVLQDNGDRKEKTNHLFLLKRAQKKPSMPQSGSGAK
jgi:hypothetical protein